MKHSKLLEQKLRRDLINKGLLRKLTNNISNKLWIDISYDNQLSSEDEMDYDFIYQMLELLANRWPYSKQVKYIAEANNSFDSKFSFKKWYDGLILQSITIDYKTNYKNKRKILLEDYEIYNICINFKLDPRKSPIDLFEFWGEELDFCNLFKIIEDPKNVEYANIYFEGSFSGD